MTQPKETSAGPRGWLPLEGHQCRRMGTAPNCSEGCKITEFQQQSTNIGFRTTPGSCEYQNSEAGQPPPLPAPGEHVSRSHEMGNADASPMPLRTSSTDVVQVTGENITPEVMQELARARNLQGSAAHAQPQLPPVDLKVVMRPRRGFKATQLPTVVERDGVLCAAEITYDKASGDTLHVNFKKNMLTMSTPRKENAVLYSKITTIRINAMDSETVDYVTAPEDTSKGVIHGISKEETQEDIKKKSLVNVRNASRHPPCTGDVCPNPKNVRCRDYRAANPGQDHKCTPRCQLCGKELKCKELFCTPYIMKKRQWEQQQERQSRPRERGVSAASGSSRSCSRSFPPLGAERQARSRSESKPRHGARSKSRDQPRLGQQQPPRTTLGNIPDSQVGWADRVAQKAHVKDHGRAHVAPLPKNMSQPHNECRSARVDYLKTTVGRSLRTVYVHAAL
ncbi:hypothetical protein HPB49_007985 [Dermacentor silvarum]|uniref:Uncharacterized protein n=1 Tax=Dermacentor silvarum TaxID=543639 RepID=A0ACB8C8E3_DERSI|nr:hypothetical protein HPB49_007985 [Dermacentor silvarum]